MDAIDVIVKHYKDNEKQHIDIPEWEVNGQPMRIFWNLLTVEERTRLAKGQNDVDGLIAMARTESGAKMFTIEHKPQLLKVADAGIISRVVEAMLASARINKTAVADAVKN